MAALRDETEVAEDYGWAATGGGTVMPPTISFQCADIWISTGLHFVCARVRACA
jgi:hypothetical protein